jgi:alpha-L-rhamnosidase
VPTPQGNIEVYADKKTMKIKSADGAGILRLHSIKQPVTEKGVELKKLGDNYYEIALNKPNREYIIRYY